MRRLLTFVVVAGVTCAAALWWVADGDRDRALRPVSATADEARDVMSGEP